MVRANLKVSRKGQLTLRKELLHHLGISPGQRLEVQVLPGGRLELQAERPRGTLAEFVGRLAGRSDRTASLEELNAAASSGWAGIEP